MLLTLILLFTVLPMVEIALLIELWDAIGLLPTIAIALGTGVLGVALAQAQGLATLSKIQQQLRARERPTETLLDGAMILLAGVVLITPGVLTDLVGFALLVPPIRALLKPWVVALFKRRMQSRSVGGSTVHVWTSGTDTPRMGSDDPPRGDVIDAEVVEVRTKEDDAK